MNSELNEFVRLALVYFTVVGLGCQGSGGYRDESDAELDAVEEIDDDQLCVREEEGINVVETVTVTALPEGNTVQGPRGMVIEFPVRTGGRSVEFKVSVVDARPCGIHVLSEVYLFEPNVGFVAWVSIRYNARELEGGRESLHVWQANRFQEEQWWPYKPDIVDEENEIVTMRTEAVSKWWCVGERR